MICCQDHDDDTSSGFCDGSSLNTSHEDCEKLKADDEKETIDNSEDEVKINVPKLYIPRLSVCGNLLTERKTKSSTKGIDYFGHKKSIETESDSTVEKEHSENKKKSVRTVDMISERRSALANGMRIALRKSRTNTPSTGERFIKADVNSDKIMEVSQRFDLDLCPSERKESFSVYKKLGGIEPSIKSRISDIDDSVVDQFRDENPDIDKERDDMADLSDTDDEFVNDDDDDDYQFFMRCQNVITCYCAAHCKLL